VTEVLCVASQVIGRVKINKIINPDVWYDRSTYLKVEVEDMPDSDEGVRPPTGTTLILQ
jgi:hypothetical protein